MKKFAFSVLGIVSVLASGFAIGLADQAAAYMQQLENTDPSVRAGAIDNLTREIKKILPPWKHPTEATFDDIATNFFPVIARGMSDKNEGVREASLHALGVIATTRGAWKGFGHDKDVYAPLKTGITDGMSEADPTLRSGVYMLYAECFGTPPDVQEAWIRAFSSEANMDVKKGILRALLISNSCTPSTMRFVIGELNDPAYTYDVGASVVANIKPIPPEVLAILANRYANSPEPAERAFLGEAMQQAGSEAQSYIPLLQTMFAKETDPTAKENLRYAIKSIGTDAASPKLTGT